MIARLNGKVVLREDNDGFLIIDIGGVGYRAFVSNDTLSKTKEGEVATLWIHMVVRENLINLYGFVDKQEKSFFELLIGISGIGPKSALAILSLAPVYTLRKAVSSGDSSYLTSVSGIGKKSAERIIIELRDKLGKITKEDGVGLKEEAEALEALRALGYTLQDSREALKKIPENVSSINNRIKEALKILGNG